jgi:hypothetical protein
VCFFCSLAGLFAFGEADAGEEEVQNKEWTLCITAFDVSALPASRRIVGEALVKNLVEILGSVERRYRLSEEYTYYKDYAWAKSRTGAAKNLAAKREERDLLAYRGEPEWKYQRTLKTVDDEIKRLEEVLKKTESETPLVAEEPVFKFTEGNINGNFPSPPKAGGEYRFCVDQRADAFLCGTVSEFHGRIYISLKMYTVYTNSFQYQDDIIFSSDDIQSAMDEIAGRLVEAASGVPPAFIAVHPEPEDAAVLLNGSLAARGDMPPREHTPGPVDVEIFADNYEALTQPIRLYPGELAEIFVKLRPINFSPLQVDVPGKPGSLVYQGALYLGETPLSVNLPMNRYEYIRVETPEGETGSVAYIPAETKGNSTPDLIINTKMPPPAGEKPVDKIRGIFYGAYGRFWIALPVAFILGGLYTTQLNTYNYQPTEDMYNTATDNYYLSIGAMALAGLALTETFYQLFRYIYTAGDNTTLIAP